MIGGKIMSLLKMFCVPPRIFEFAHKNPAKLCVRNFAFSHKSIAFTQEILHFLLKIFCFLNSLYLSLSCAPLVTLFRGSVYLR